MFDFLKKLWPSSVIKEIKENRLEIKASLSIIASVFLSIVISIPLFMILFVRQVFDDQYNFFGDITATVQIVAFVLLVVPFIFVFVESFIIFMCLRLVRSPISYHKVALARTNGLVPFILLLPIRALLVNPNLFTTRLFWPTWIGLIVSVTKDFISFPDVLSELASVFTSTNIFGILLVIVLLIWTFIRTAQTLSELGEIQSNKAYLATFIEIMVWDLISLGMAIVFSLQFV